MGLQVCCCYHNSMEGEKPGEGNSPSLCHLESCDDEVFLACNHCNEFVCYFHISNHGCKGRQLQIVKESLNPAVNLLQVLALVKLLIISGQIQASQLQEMISSYFSPETLNKLSSFPMWSEYITSNKLWKKYCYFPELYWKESETNPAILEKQQLSTFSLGKYNYDHERLLLKNWESGIVQVRRLNIGKRRLIKLMKDTIDSFGKHWLFITDGVTLDILEIRNEDKLHLRCRIKYLKNINLPIIKIVLSNEKLFIIWRTFVEVYAFCNPDYFLEYLYSFYCDEDINLQHYYQQGIDSLNNLKVRSFCIHVLEKAIIGHAGFTCSGFIQLHIWDPNTGDKIMVACFPLPHQTDISRVYVKSELSNLDDDILFNAAIYLNDGSEFTFLMNTNINNAITGRTSSSCYTQASMYSTECEYNEPYLDTSFTILPDDIVFFKKVSKYEIIVCRQNNRQLNFCILGINGRQLNKVHCSFSEPLNKSTLIPFFKIYLFEGMSLLCIAVKNRKIKVIDLKSTIKQQTLQTKFLCKVKDVKKIHFVNPKFVLILFDKKDVGELWDAEEGNIICNVNISNDYLFDKVTWHGLTFLPPSKLIVATKHDVFILDFETKK